MPQLIEIGLMVAIIIFASAAAKAMFGAGGKSPGSRRHERKLAGMTKNERDKALEVYRDLAKEKLDVMKNAIAMGYTESELESLDKRLEKLIGRDKLEEIIDGGLPQADHDMLDRDLLRERQRLRENDKRR
jgi:hypothetical protein